MTFMDGVKLVILCDGCEQLKALINIWLFIFEQIGIAV